MASISSNLNANPFGWTSTHFTTNPNPKTKIYFTPSTLSSKPIKWEGTHFTNNTNKPIDWDSTHFTGNVDYSKLASLTPSQVSKKDWYDIYGNRVKFDPSKKFGSTYSLYSRDGKVEYHFNSKGELVSATPWTGFLTKYKPPEGSKTPIKITNQTTNQTASQTTNKTNTNYGTSTNYDSQYNAIANALTNQISALKAEIEELKNPRILTVEEAAEKWLSLDAINEAKVLADYNNKTNQYYDELLAENNRLRTDNIRANNDFYSEAIDDYLDSYKYAAPTALRRATTAANTLATDLQTAYNLSQNDYGLFQNNLNFEADRRKELAENPWLAKQQVNKLRQTLTGLTANEYASEVKKRAAEVNAYATKWQGLRNTQAMTAQGIQNRYSGLTQAASSLAQSAASAYGTNKVQALYDMYYNKYNGNKQLAGNATYNTMASIRSN